MEWVEFMYIAPSEIEFQWLTASMTRPSFVEIYTLYYHAIQSTRSSLEPGLAVAHHRAEVENDLSIVLDNSRYSPSQRFMG